MSGISREQALDCFASDDLIGIGMEADAVRRRLHPEGAVSYAVDRVIACGEDSGAIEGACAETIEDGGTGVLLRGLEGRELGWVERLLSGLTTRVPELCVQLAVEEVAGLSGSLPLRETLPRLGAAGLRSVRGEGFLEVHRAAHAAGLRTTVGLRFGRESLEARVEMLEAIRGLQEETGGFVAFTLAALPAESGRELDDPTAVEYLKTLAICRMTLENIDNVEANWEQQGMKVLQVALRFGANDAGSLLGAAAMASEETVRHVIRDAGFRPVQRDSLYRAMMLV